MDRIKAGNLILDHIPDAEFVSGVMKTTDRKDAYTEINEGTNSVVATYGVAAVGINIPYLTRPPGVGKSFVPVIQSIDEVCVKHKIKTSVEISGYYKYRKV